jgi:hypothetical protein
MTVLGIGFAVISFLLLVVVRLFKKNRQLTDKVNIAYEFNRDLHEQAEIASKRRPDSTAIDDSMSDGQL